MDGPTRLCIYSYITENQFQTELLSSMNSLYIWIAFALAMCPWIEQQIQDKFIGDIHSMKKPAGREARAG